jgi:hypothetical protein
MAQKRMIDKKISVSEQVSDLPLQSQILFTWAIPHTDDMGLLPYSLKTLKALIVPMQDWTLDQFTSYWKKITDMELITEFVYEGRKFWRVAKFFKFQSLRKDIQPFCILQVELCRTPKESWDKLYAIMEQLGVPLEAERNEDVTETVQDVNNPSTKEKGREDKRSKEKIDSGADAPTPKDIAIEFFQQVEYLKDGKDHLAARLIEKIKNICAKTNAPYENILKEIIKFSDYWTELNSTGKKQRWEKQPTFEINRRLSTWFGNIKVGTKPRGRELIT